MVFERIWEFLQTRFTRADAARLVSSLILATMLWGYVSLITDPEETESFAGLELAPVNDLDDDLILTSELPVITVRLTGPESVIEDISPGEISVSLDTEDLDGPNPAFEARVRIDAPDGVRESSADPSFVPIAVSARATPREVTLTARIVDQPEAATLVVGTLEPDVSMVTISGPTSAVDRVVKVELPIEIGDHRTDFSETFVPVALDADGAPIPEVQIQPQQVSTDVSVTLRGHQVAVFVDVTGQPASGYQVGEQRTIPLSIVVDGPDDVLDSIVYVYTQPVDITNATEDVSTTVAIDQESLPEGVRILTPTTGNVQVIIQISQRASPQTLPGQTVQVFGLATGLDDSAEPAEIDVIVETSTQQIARLQPGDIVVSVDASGLGPGTYRLQPSVSVPPEMSWIRTEPELVTVTITESNAFNGDALPGLGDSGSGDDEVSPEASPAQSPPT